MLTNVEDKELVLTSSRAHKGIQSGGLGFFNMLSTIQNANCGHTSIFMMNN